MARRRPHKRKAAPEKTATVRIAAIGARGDGVAESDGGAVYVPYTAPGDLVRVKLRGERGALTELIETSAHRAKPPCQYFGACGSCALQHLETAFYRKWKRDLVVNALKREGFTSDSVGALIACPPSSRRRATVAVLRRKQDTIVGFNKRRSTEILDIDNCIVMAPALANHIAGFRKLAAAIPHRAFDMALTLCDNGVDIDVQCGDADFFRADAIERLADVMRGEGFIRLTLNGEPVLEFQKPSVSFGGVPVAIPPGAFLQASREAETVLIDHVLEHSGAATRIADLFCGCGTFALPVASRAQVDAFDADRDAVGALDAAVRNARLNHPVAATARNLFEQPLMAEDLKPYDAVIFDPPRAGARAQAEELARSQVPVVIGVSCNPGTFARDAAILRAGGYALSQVTPVDQFVYSAHVELVGVFQKR
ncbi:MAG: class I SAM-dependent RNA methyltransferase [Hyphococcus sp.]